MHVLELRAENFKRLVAVDITTDPLNPTVVISGANAQGKSSVLDAIWAALGGAKASPEDPIRHGARGAKVSVTLDDLVVTREWKGTGTTLKVTNRAGGTVSSPQRILDELVGKMAFDPLQFALADPKVQRETLLSVVDIGIDLDRFAQARKDVYDARTNVNREVKRLEAHLSSLPTVAPGTPDDEVSAAEAASKMQLRMAADAALAQATTRWQEIETEIARLRAEQQEVEKAGRAAQGAVNVLPEAHLMQRQLADADQINIAVRDKRERRRVEVELETLRQSSQTYTDELEKADASKAEALARAGMPVAGLGFDDDGVTLNGVAFKQASAAERLRVSVAIAMAKNPKLRVILIRDASLLDSSNMALIEQMALEHDFQVWVEKVDETGEVGIVIEDGAVA